MNWEAVFSEASLMCLFLGLVYVGWWGARFLVVEESAPKSRFGRAALTVFQYARAALVSAFIAFLVAQAHRVTHTENAEETVVYSSEHITQREAQRFEEQAFAFFLAFFAIGAHGTYIGRRTTPAEATKIISRMKVPRRERVECLEFGSGAEDK